MKRYDFKAHFDPYYGCEVAEPEERSDGEWVKASVAQALYDALKPFTRKETLRDTYSFEIDQAIKALSLADGETE